MIIPDGFTEPGSGASPYTVLQPVLWGEMDALGHVNNATYLRWFESVRFLYFEHIGLVAVHREESKGPILAHTAVDFLAPVRFPDEVLLSTKAIHLGRSSFTAEHRVWSIAQDRLVARGTGVIVMFDYGRGGSIPIPEAIRAAIVALDGPEESGSDR
jgi:acyl-CoA thioester hydrolase